MSKSALVDAMLSPLQNRKRDKDVRVALLSLLDGDDPVADFAEESDLESFRQGLKSFGVNPGFFAARKMYSAGKRCKYQFLLVFLVKGSSLLFLMNGFNQSHSLSLSMNE